VNFSVGIALGYGLDDRSSRVRFPVGVGIFLFTTASRTAVGPTEPPTQWVTGSLSPGVKRPGRKADHSLPSGAEVKECVELYLHFPTMPSWGGAQLNKKNTGIILPFTCMLHIYLIILSYVSLKYNNGVSRYVIFSSLRLHILDRKMKDSDLIGTCHFNSEISFSIGHPIHTDKSN
jgi:hypothetical protein